MWNLVNQDICNKLNKGTSYEFKLDIRSSNLVFAHMIRGNMNIAIRLAQSVDAKTKYDAGIIVQGFERKMYTFDFENISLNELKQAIMFIINFYQNNETVITYKPISFYANSTNTIAVLMRPDGKTANVLLSRHILELMHYYEIIKIVNIFSSEMLLNNKKRNKAVMVRGFLRFRDNTNIHKSSKKLELTYMFK